MNIANGMRTMTENITASRNARVKSLGSLVSEVSQSLADARNMVGHNAAARKAMSKEQGAELACFAGDLASRVKSQLKGFRKELELAAGDRAISAKELKSHLRAEARGLRNRVKKTLSDYSHDHAAMSQVQRHNLRGYANGIVKAVGDLTAASRGLMSGYREDMRKARNIWGNMTRTSAKGGGKRAALPVIRAKEESGSAKEAPRKIQKRKKMK